MKTKLEPGKSNTKQRKYQAAQRALNWPYPKESGFFFRGVCFCHWWWLFFVYRQCVAYTMDGASFVICLLWIQSSRVLKLLDQSTIECWMLCTLVWCIFTYIALARTSVFLFARTHTSAHTHSCSHAVCDTKINSIILACIVGENIAHCRLHHCF